MRKAILGLTMALMASKGAAADPLSQISVDGGALRGVVQGSVAKFLGVPFAAPPVGDNRWRAPQPVVAWSGERAADHMAPACLQKNPRQVSSEDCLYANIWTPANSKNDRLPVLIWAYGGGFNSGSARGGGVEGLAKTGVIVVTYNYRLGALGFLAHPKLTAETNGQASGAYGVLDSVAILKWVRANISAFGGDPNAITFGGLSSGAGVTKMMDVSPLTHGLYARAIVMSGPRVGNGGRTLKQAEEEGVKFANSLGTDSLAALRAIPADKILAASNGFEFAPIYDGYALPRSPFEMVRQGQFNKTPLLTGNSAEEQTGSNPKADTMTAEECGAYIDQEAGGYGPQLKAVYVDPSSSNCYEGIRDLARDRNLLSGFDWVSARLANGSPPIFTYIFNHPQPGPNAARDRSFHGVETPYFFGLPKPSAERPFTQADSDISAKMIGYWSNFIKTGNPNGAGLPKWPSAESKKPQTMELGDKFSPRPLVDEPKAAVMKAYLAEVGSKVPFEGHLPFSR